MASAIAEFANSTMDHVPTRGGGASLVLIEIGISYPTPK